MISFTNAHNIQLFQDFINRESNSIILRDKNDSFRVILPDDFMSGITTVPLKWTNRSLKSLKYSLLRAVSKANGLEFVTLQPQRIAYVSRQVCVLSTFLVSQS